MADGSLLRRRTRVAILLGVSAIYFVSFFQRVAVPGTVFDELQVAFGMNASQVAALGTIYLYLYGFLQPLVGVSVDRWGAGRALVASGLLLAVGSVLFPLAQTAALLYATRAIIGIGAAMAYLCLIKEVDELFGERDFPFYLGLGMTLGYAGGLLGTYPFERVVDAVGWRPALLGVGAFCTVAWLYSAWLLHRTGRLVERPGVALGGWVKVVLVNRAFWPPMITCGINFAIYFLVQATLGKKFLQDVAGLSSEKAAAFTFAMMAVCMAGVLASGLLTRFLTRRRPIVIGGAAAIVMATLTLLAGVSFALPAGVYLAGYLLLGLAPSLSVVYGTIAKELNPRPAAGTSIGVVNAGAYLSVALLISVAGIILDSYGGQPAPSGTALVYPVHAYRTIFALCTGLAVVSLYFATRVRETAPAPLLPEEETLG